jgi:hypothetical protein
MAYTTINKSTDYFNTKLYTGNATDDRSITGVGFQPDFSWVKRRDSAGSHRLKDSIRGATKTLISNSTSAESTEANVFQAFESDGFQLGSDSVLNASGATYASWNWLGENGTASNTDGSITSTVSANTTSGFSIVSYTGTGSNATVGHGLGSVPKMVICKNRSSGSVGWSSWHTGIGDGNNYILLNTTQSTLTASNIWNSTIPTSSVISVGSHPSTNESGSNMIAYCFAEKKGFSKFGSYTGNGNADGTFVYTGFKPAMVIVKDSTSTGQWFMRDNKRDTYNAAVKTLYANGSSAEEDSQPWDMLSNGFKMRNTDSDLNNSGETYIYMAFAEAPLVGTNNIPATAR